MEANLVNIGDDSVVPHSWLLAKSAPYGQNIFDAVQRYFEANSNGVAIEVTA